MRFVGAAVVLPRQQWGLLGRQYNCHPNNGSVMNRLRWVVLLVGALAVLAFVLFAGLGLFRDSRAPRANE